MLYKTKSRFAGNHLGGFHYLITVCQPSHAAHDAKHVVVGGIHTHLRGRAHTHRIVGHRQQESGVINARQVARAAGLVLLRGESKGVHVDTNGGHVGVVLVGLHLVEIATLTHGEPVVAVELQEGSHHGVVTSHALNAGHGVTRLQAGAVPPIGVVERLLALPGCNHGLVARHEGITLHNPDELLARVVEVQLELVGGGVDGLGTSVLESLNQVLVADLGELATLVRVQVDVVHVERGGHQVGGVHAVTHGVGVVGHARGVVPHQVLQVVELQIDTDLVVLEGNQRQSQPRVAVEPELERHVQRVLRGTAEQGRGAEGLTASTVVVARLATLHHQVGQLGHVANHLGIASLLASLLGELIPDLEPVTVVLVNTLSTNLQLNPVNQVVPHPVEPAELSTRPIGRGESHCRQSGLEVDAVNQVTITLNGARHLVTETGVAVKGVLNRLHGKVRVAAVHELEEGNLGITGQINILGTVGNQLHQTTTCHLLYPHIRKKIWRNALFYEKRRKGKKAKRRKGEKAKKFET